MPSVRRSLRLAERPTACSRSSMCLAMRPSPKPRRRRRARQSKPAQIQPPCRASTWRRCRCRTCRAMPHVSASKWLAIWWCVDGEENPTVRLIYPESIEDIALGATVLGTGGGGDPYIGKLLAMQALRQYGPVRLVSTEEVEDDALVAQSAMMGAPTVMIEKLPSGTEVVRAFESLQD